ncbi:MAG TPA: hypothetical protein VL282_17685 [Tepidisphaeraceae bacterium]|jgi:hypothetical protein|nr:hypothetical protein [Tepidisphaeraceae bacterium]
MKSVLNQLDNDEAVLLMYLSDELSHQERSQVDRRLAAEPALRLQLDSMRGAQDSTLAAMQMLDNSERLPTVQGAASRRVIRAMQRWQAGREIEQAAQAKPNRFRFYIPVWTYPVAAAAIIIVGFVLWGMNIEVNHNANSKSTSGDFAWTGDSAFQAPPLDDISPVAEQYAKLEETIDDTASLTAVDDQVNSLSDWSAPYLPRDVAQ